MGPAIPLFTKDHLNQANADKFELTQLRRIFDHINEMIFVIDRHGPQGPFFSFLSTNHQMQLGKSEEPLLGMTMKRFVEKYIHEDDRYIYDQWESDREKPIPTEIFPRVRRADTGEVRWMRVRTFPLFENDIYSKSVALVEDISDQQQLQHKLNAERTAQITSAKMASIGILAAGVAHEVNNPLHILKNYVSSLQEDLPKKDLAKITAAMDRSIDQISSIVKSLLTYSRDESNDELSMVPLSVAIDNAVTLLTEQLRTQGIAFKTIGERPKDIKLKCLPGELSRVFYNIISNAIDAIESVEDRWISCDIRKNAALRTVEIRIANAGPLLGSEAAEKFALPFFTTKPVNKGTGLGLFISAKILEGYRGTLTIDRTNKHTCFMVSLPMGNPV